jgi:hypothetical protein
VFDGEEKERKGSAENYSVIQRVDDQIQFEVISPASVPPLSKSSMSLIPTSGSDFSYRLDRPLLFPETFNPVRQSPTPAIASWHSNAHQNRHLIA